MDDNIYAAIPGPNLFEGGTAAISIDDDIGDSDTINFIIAGQNPSTTAIRGALLSLNPPWFFGKLLTQESSNQQFVGRAGLWNYTPLYGPPDGFGLTQLDGKSPLLPDGSQKLSDEVLWNWLDNLTEGVGFVWTFQSHAYGWISGQTSQAAQAGISAPFEYAQYGTCQPMYWTGTGQTGIQDAEWMVEYNGGYYAVYNNKLKNWSVYPTYVNAVCNAQSATM